MIDRCGQTWLYGDAPHLVLRSTDGGVHLCLDLTTGEECSLYEPESSLWDELDNRADTPLRRFA